LPRYIDTPLTCTITCLPRTPPGSSLPPLEPPSKPSFQHHASLVITTPAQLHRIITTSRSRGGAFGWFIALILCTAPKFYAKSIKRPSKQASRTISVKQAKPASSRCLKLQASKLKALSLACLLVTNSGLDCLNSLVESTVTEIITS
jgi:hypothetical protein